MSSIARGRTSARSLILAVLLIWSATEVPKLHFWRCLNLHLLDLVVGHVQSELLNTTLDGVPASQSRGEVNISGHAKVSRVDDLVCARLVEDGLGVDTSLVGEGTETGDVVVEGDVDLDGLSDKILNLLELVELVSGGDVVVAVDDHTGQETSERGDTVTLADTEN